MKKRLPVNIHHEMTTYLTYALPLCILTANPKMIPWIMENYLVFLGYGNDDYNMGFWVADAQYFISDTLHYSGINNIDSKMFDVKYYDIETVKKYDENVIDEIIGKTRDNYYSIIFLDEYYLPESYSAGKSHFVHETLCYGYDDEKKEFDVVGFRGSNYSKLSSFRISYCDLADAFRGAKEHFSLRDDYQIGNQMITFLKVREYFADYITDTKEVIRKLTNYLNSCAPLRDNFHLNLGACKNIKNEQYGIDMVYLVRQYFEKYVFAKKNDDLRNMEELLWEGLLIAHFISQTKKVIFRRLEWLYEKCGCFDFDVYSYEKIVSKYELCLFKYIKLLQAMDSIGNVENIKQKILVIVQDLENIVPVEKSILRNILGVHY